MSSSLPFSTLVELLRYRASQQPNKIAYTYLPDNHQAPHTLTYEQLDQESRAIASKLQMWQATGERALLIYPPGLDFLSAFWGCLYAGVIAIPAPPPDPLRLKRTLPRLKAIIQDSQATIILTTSHIYSHLKSQLTELSELQWLTSDQIAKAKSNDWQMTSFKGDDLAYLQYTSGSTATPKGVMISHQNVLHHSQYIQQAWGYTSESIAVTWMPYFHDYGLIDGLIQPLYTGVPCYILSPLGFIKRPLRWLETISRYKATHTQGPNFAYEYCLHNITEEKKHNLDLSFLKTASNGAESIRPETVEKFIKTFESCGFRSEAFYPAYGLAEATLLVTTKPHDTQPRIKEIIDSEDPTKKNRRIVSCGLPVGEMNVIIVNPDTLSLCSASEMGEIWINDPSVAQGYWQNLEATGMTFKAYLKETEQGPFLRTGDLGFIEKGELFVTGRLKDLIIIGGVNHYPQDIEWTVEKSHSAIRLNNCAAFSIDENGLEKVVILAEVERRTSDFPTVVEAIRQAVDDHHELEVAAISLLKRGSILKTSSGKIQRQGCRQAFLGKSLDSVFEWNKNQEIQALNQRFASVSATEIKAWLIAYLSKELEINPQEIHQKISFIDSGLSSSEILFLSADLETWLGYPVSPTVIFDCETIEGLSIYLSRYQTVPS
ncbi:4-hydroxyphenylalkanoate adenylyltransferase [Microcystis aeruginosa NIES-1211]|jgi:acyl-CoA synthetase (AMP-forming)/AMP-acid ligase II/acyl carrier protein|uniref:AMP-binding protein n=1 Tax=Microcystis TaxID=1125 RepID=UPI0002622F5E|nr:MULTISPECIES: AMP-binding protein [Microcystis]GBL15496.1 4-hydroxyphenylalkanoate adenylyltransferase [Microcystis aeruginosa NIES-1211]CCI31028.1 Putative fatty-acid--CoA ligase (Acyl-CoA synthetase) [Microcystis sp. T1-4]